MLFLWLQEVVLDPLFFGGHPQRVTDQAATTASELGSWERNVNDSGEYCRKPTTFRNAVSAAEGSRFLPESGRYHLFISLACPWAQRVMITRKLKGLEAHLSYDVTDSLLAPDGWSFARGEPEASGDSLYGSQKLRDIYTLADPGYTGSVTVPVLWDKQERTIVNNESGEIVRMLNSEFQALAAHPAVNLLPEALRAEIDALNQWVYADLNNGVYEAGFAKSQSAYDGAAKRVFVTLDRLEALLAERRYLFGAVLTEADVRLFPTLIRFDSVYNTHFKCNQGRVIDYPNLWGYVRDLYTRPEFRETTNFVHIVRHYYRSHLSLNPSQIIPLGPTLDLEAPHGRERLS